MLRPRAEEASLRTLAITQSVTVDGSIEMLGDWFDPQGQAAASGPRVPSALPGQSRTRRRRRDGDDNRILEETFECTGVTIMGKRMFDAGERSWPEEAPFHTPVFVLTHQKRKPWERPAGTVFHFVNDGYESALR
jgi:dihydrofolate reductase